MVKKIITGVLIGFVVASLAVMIVREKESGNSPAVDVDVVEEKAPVQAEVTSQIPSPQRVIMAYYFHGDKRCKTCVSIEEMAQQTIEREFPLAMAAEELQWKTINVDQPENEHFIDDYQLAAKTIVLSEVVEGKEVNWVNLDQVWELVHEPEEYISYIKKNVGTMLDTDVKVEEEVQ
jgi:hypothetical protein